MTVSPGMLQIHSLRLQQVKVTEAVAAFVFHRHNKYKIEKENQRNVSSKHEKTISGPSLHSF